MANGRFPPIQTDISPQMTYCANIWDSLSLGKIAPLSSGPSGGDSVEEWLKIARNVGNGNISDAHLVLFPNPTVICDSSKEST